MAAGSAAGAARTLRGVRIGRRRVEILRKCMVVLVEGIEMIEFVVLV
jgi:hypothetical protein